MTLCDKKKKLVFLIEGKYSSLSTFGMNVPYAKFKIKF